VTPAFAIQFFFKGQWSWINQKIEDAILEADRSGVKVVGLGALNKNEALVRDEMDVRDTSGTSGSRSCLLSLSYHELLTISFVLCLLLCAFCVYIVRLHHSGVTRVCGIMLDHLALYMCYNRMVADCYLLKNTQTFEFE
jgi:hypothetical protein